MKRIPLFLAMMVPIALSAQNKRETTIRKSEQFIEKTTPASILLTAGQQPLTAEKLWELGRVSALSQSPDGEHLLYKVARTDLATEKVNSTHYLLNLKTRESQVSDLFGDKSFIQWDENGLYARKDDELYLSTDEGKTWKLLWSNLAGASDLRIAADGQKIAFSKEVVIAKTLGKDKYSDVPNTTAHIYTDLDYRHWDAWNQGKVKHVFVANLADAQDKGVDIMEGKPFSSPQIPFGGAEDFIFTQDGLSVLYVTKEKVGKEYAQSTNTDIFQYVISSGETTNLSAGMMGYDVSPKLSPDGKRVAWLSMKHDGYEADKNNLMVMDLAKGTKLNLTSSWDETVDGDFRWSNDGARIDFSASVKGTKNLFTVQVPANLMVRMLPVVQELAKGAYNINSIIMETKDGLIVGRTDFNRATELFHVNTKNGNMEAVTHANDDQYRLIKSSQAELRMVSTKDGKEMGVWVIYPPDFDPTKKYPTLLYCQGGPQSALTQSYSLRWNFQLMAANGYIIVAPNRRGMPGWGVEWNQAISKDWGGAVMQDYLDAIDAIAQEPYVDSSRLGCVGASYGGYSAFMLAGIHENRFKSFIAHDGLFDMKSWYGTTEELFFANWDLGGSYWDTPTPEAYTKFNPSNYVAKWTAPIYIIQGELDYRVPIGQGLQAFQAAQLRGIKSKLLYFPNENHWVLHPHNGLVWQREFFDWLKQTL